MKKVILTCIYIFTTFINVNAQKNEIAKASEIVWYGLDFSNSKFVGKFDHGFGIAPVTGSDLKFNWIPKWNNLVVTEQQNYEIAKALKKPYVYYDIKAVNTINDKINPETLLDYNENNISDATITEMIKKYKAGDKKEGLGLVFIVSSFNKTVQMAKIHVVFFDIATKKIVSNETYIGKAAGAGMLNYWAGAIKHVIKQMSKKF